MTDTTATQDPVDVGKVEAAILALMSACKNQEAKLSQQLATNKAIPLRWNLKSKSLPMLLTLFLPGVVTFLADLLRQYGFAKVVNEAITRGLVLAARLTMALFNRHLGSNLELDFLTVVAYTAALVQSPALQPLQGYLQSNTLAFVKAAAQLQPASQPTTPANVVALPYRLSRGGAPSPAQAAAFQARPVVADHN